MKKYSLYFVILALSAFMCFFASCGKGEVIDIGSSDSEYVRLMDYAEDYLYGAGGVGNDNGLIGECVKNPEAPVCLAILIPLSSSVEEPSSSSEEELLSSSSETEIDPSSSGESEITPSSSSEAEIEPSSNSTVVSSSSVAPPSSSSSVATPSSSSRPSSSSATPSSSSVTPSSSSATPSSSSRPPSSSSVTPSSSSRPPSSSSVTPSSSSRPPSSSSIAPSSSSRPSSSSATPSSSSGASSSSAGTAVSCAYQTSWCGDKYATASEVPGLPTENNDANSMINGSKNCFFVTDISAVLANNSRPTINGVTMLGNHNNNSGFACNGNCSELLGDKKDGGYYVYNGGNNGIDNGGLTATRGNPSCL